MKQRTLSLEVQECYTRDYGRTIARIDPDSMHYLGVSAGDALEIRRALLETNEKPMTVVKCMSIYPSDDGKGIVRLSKLVRKNAGDVSVGDNVILKKIPSILAKKVILTQVEPTLPVREQYPPISGEWIAECLETMPVIKGDTVTVPYFGGRTWFKVIDVNPDVPAVATRDTVCELTEVKA